MSRRTIGRGMLRTLLAGAAAAALALTGAVSAAAEEPAGPEVTTYSEAEATSVAVASGETDAGGTDAGGTDAGGTDAGGTDAGTDATLIERATISGQVTSAADGSPIWGSVELVSAAGSWTALTSPSGSYSAVVAPGEYTVRFVPGYGLQAEYWEDALTESEATTVSVIAGQSLSGIDARIDEAVAITGTVTSDGDTVAHAVIEAWQDGELVGTTLTDVNGGYRLFVPAGEYLVSAFGLVYSPVHARQFYGGSHTPADATIVVLGPDADHPGVDFDLSLGGVIQGMVSAGEGPLPAEGAVVTAYLAGEEGWSPIVSVITTGAYDFSAYDDELQMAGAALPAGTYTIGVEAEGFCPQFLGGGATLDEAETVELAGGQTQFGVDVSLTAGCPAPTPQIALSSGSVQAGGDIEIVGENFAPGETVAFELHSDPIALGALTADQQGHLEGTLAIPATVPVGLHTLVALGAESEIEASVVLEVTAAASAPGPGDGGGATGGGTASGDTATPRGGLASTGADIPSAGLLAGLMLAVVGLFLARRRRAAG